MNSDSQSIDVRLLPPQIRCIAKVIGLTETIVLIKARGGIRLHIPTQADRAVVLKAFLQTDSIILLVKAFGGRRLEIPKDDKITQQLRNQLIRQSRSSMSASEIARQHHLTRRHVINISRPEDVNPTLELFPLDKP